MRGDGQGEAIRIRCIAWPRCRDRQGNPGKSRLARRARARLVSRHITLPVRVAQRLRADSALGQKQAQPLGIAGDEGKRLNRNDFSYFPGIMSRLSQWMCLPFRNLWSLFWNDHARVCRTCSSEWKKPRINMAPGLNGLERIWR